MSALDFPTSPNDGDTYEGYVYNAAKGVWQWQALTPSLVSLTDTTISSPASGDVLEYDGTNWVNAAVGKILQVVQSDETVQHDITSSSFTDIPGASVTITPQSASSKVLVSFHITRNAPRGNGRFIRYRLTATSGADTGELARYLDANGNNEIETTITATKLMSPATTSPVTFQLQGLESSGLAFRTSNIYLIAMEVAA